MHSLVSGLIIVVSSLCVGLVVHRIQRPTGPVRISIIYFLTLIGSSIGLFLFSLLSIPNLPRTVRFIATCVCSISVSIIIVSLYFEIRKHKSSED